MAISSSIRGPMANRIQDANRRHGLSFPLLSRRSILLGRVRAVEAPSRQAPSDGMDAQRRRLQDARDPVRVRACRSIEGTLRHGQNAVRADARCVAPTGCITRTGHRRTHSAALNPPGSRKLPRASEFVELAEIPLSYEGSAQPPQRQPSRSARLGAQC